MLLIQQIIAEHAIYYQPLLTLAITYLLTQRLALVAEWLERLPSRLRWLTPALVTIATVTGQALATGLPFDEALKIGVAGLFGGSALHEAIRARKTIALSLLLPFALIGCAEPHEPKTIADEVAKQACLGKADIDHEARAKGGACKGFTWEECPKRAELMVKYREDMNKCYH